MGFIPGATTRACVARTPQDRPRALPTRPPPPTRLGRAETTTDIHVHSRGKLNNKRGNLIN